MRVLFVKLGSIGDIVHTLPALAAVGHALPDAEISWAVESRSAEILRENTLIDNLIEVDTRSLRAGRSVDQILPEIRRQVTGIRKFRFDVAIDFQGLLKSALIAKLSGAKRRIGFARKELREPASRVLLNKSVKTDAQIHVIRKNLQLLEGALQIPVPSGFEFPIQTSPGDIAEAGEIAEQAAGHFAILNPAGGWVTKLWHAEKFGMLADRIWEQYGLTSVVATGPKEIDLAKKVEAASRSGKLLLRQPSLKAFYELVRTAKVYVGGDTGPTHLAVAAGAPVVGIFGPTEWWRNGSPSPGDICVERMDIGCRLDCHRRTCNNWICMDINVETVFEAVRRRLENKN